MGRDTLHEIRLLKAQSSLYLRDGASTASWSNLFQCLTLLTVKFLPYAETKPAFFQFKALCLI